MKWTTATILLGLISLPSHALTPASIDRERDGFPDLPADARDVADRALACRQLDRLYPTAEDRRDPEVAEGREQMGCETVSKELEAIRARYRDDARVIGILDEMPEQ